MLCRPKALSNVGWPIGLLALSLENGPWIKVWSPDQQLHVNQMPTVFQRDTHWSTKDHHWRVCCSLASGLSQSWKGECLLWILQLINTLLKLQHSKFQSSQTYPAAMLGPAWYFPRVPDPVLSAGRPGASQSIGSSVCRGRSRALSSSKR